MNLTLNDAGSTLFGVHDENLKLVEEAMNVRITARGNEVHFQGDDTRVALAKKLLGDLQVLVDRGQPVRRSDLITAIRVLRENPDTNLVEFFSGDTLHPSVRKIVGPRNLAQRTYLEEIEKNDMTFAIGPAGTGKTYLAVAVASADLHEKRVKRIILCRPAVEAGEKLGFLPGDLAEKVNPYLRPLYDSLYDLIGFEKVAKYMEKGIIEVAPLAFMRGRTLSDSFIILDEAQNTTTEQMKMFLTRLGFGSKAVITGDVTQIDLAQGRMSGLIQARETLRDVEGVAFMEFTERDVVRHPLVGKIVGAYAVYEAAIRRAAEEKMNGGHTVNGDSHS